MNKLIQSVSMNLDRLSGRTAAGDKLAVFSDQFDVLPWFNDYKDFVNNFRIIGTRFSLTAQQDHSGQGVKMIWLSPEQQVDEALNFYPGIVVLKEGFLPIGACLRGSGDPYFLKLHMNEFRIFRVLHDSSTYSESMVQYITTLAELLN